MSLIYNGTTIKKLIYNGTTIKSGIYNGTEVFISGTIVTKTFDIQHEWNSRQSTEMRYVYLRYYEALYTIDNAEIISISPTTVNHCYRYWNGYANAYCDFAITFSDNIIKIAAGGDSRGGSHSSGSTTVSVTATYYDYS